MRNLLLLFLTLSLACTFPINGKKYQAIEKPLITILSTDYVHLNDDFFLNMQISDSRLSIKKIANRIFLLKEPTKEIITIDEIGSALSIKLKKTEKDIIQLTAKTSLPNETYYGVYFQDDKTKEIKLTHTFLMKPGPIKLMHHDLGEEEPFVVDDNRIIFTFTFDQPVYLHDDNAITIKDLNFLEKAVEIDSLTVIDDQKTILVRLKRSAETIFNAGENYAFFFNSGLINSNNTAASIEPIEFIATKSLDSFDELEPLIISPSSEAVMVKWSLNQTHTADLYIAEMANASFCLMSSCPLQQKSIAIAHEGSFSYKDRFYVGGLTSLNQYRFMLRSEDKSGRVILALGNFKTNMSESLRISEIMINPLTKSAEKEQSKEYIEVANIGDKDLSLKDLRISIEDMETFKVSTCDLAADFIVKKNSYFLIVASDFIKSSYEVGEDVPLVKLKQKTICGGFSNHKKKIITLERKDGYFIDRYGGHKWHTKEGESVQRINLMGLDEEHNYCYTDAGPTPGKINGSCMAS